LLLLLCTAVVAVWAPPADAVESYGINFNLGNQGTPGVEAGGEYFEWDQLTPIIGLAVTGCYGGTGDCDECPGGALRAVGTGTGTVRGGIIDWTVSIDDGCSQFGTRGVSVARAEYIIDDVIFSGGAGSGNITVSMNFEIGNELTVLSGDPLDSQANQTSVQIKRGSTIYSASNVSPGPRTTGSFTIPLGEPVQFTFRLNGSVAMEQGEAVLHAFLRFPTGGSGLTAGAMSTSAVTPVFNVPEGVTVNSVQGGIVNNMWEQGTVSTEESTWGQVKSLYR
jgi:hypothetical protein